MAYSKTLKLFTMALLVFALLLIVLPLPWSSVETPEGGKQMGAISYEIDSQLTPWRAKYNVTARVGTGGLLGGLGEGNNITVKGERYYLRGGGEALEDIGLIYDSYKVKEGRIRIKAGGGFVNLSVKVEVDSIPFYREGSKEVVRVELRVEETEVDFDEIRVEKVKVILKSQWSEGALTYLKNTTLVFTPGGKNSIVKPTEVLRWEFKVKMPKDGGRLGITAMPEISFTDSEGKNEEYILTSTPNPINLYPLTNTELVSLSGLALAGPEGVVGILLALPAYIRRRDGKLYEALKVVGGVILLIAPLHYISSMGTLGEVFSMRITGATEMVKISPVPYTVLLLAVLYLLIVLLLKTGIIKVRGWGEGKKGGGGKRVVEDKNSKGQGAREKADMEEEKASSESLFKRVD